MEITLPYWLEEEHKKVIMMEQEQAQDFLQ